MMRNISLASIIAESQQGENAARRAAPAVSEAGGFELQDPFDSGKDYVFKPGEKKTASDAGQEQFRKDQERLKKQLEEKKAAMDVANKETASVTDSLEQIKNTDYVNTFLKIFNLTSSIG